MCVAVRVFFFGKTDTQKKRVSPKKEFVQQRKNQALAANGPVAVAFTPVAFRMSLSSNAALGDKIILETNAGIYHLIVPPHAVSEVNVMMKVTKPLTSPYRVEVASGETACPRDGRGDRGARLGKGPAAATRAVQAFQDV
jgi:hypothetical protein